MEENKITAINQEKTDVLKDAYKDTLELLDAYDHQTPTRPEGNLEKQLNRLRNQ